MIEFNNTGKMLHVFGQMYLDQAQAGNILDHTALDVRNLYKNNPQYN